MKKVVCTLLLAVLLALPNLAAAAPWAVVASAFESPADATWDDREALFTVDLGSTPPRFYGPFLQGQFTDTMGSGVFDVAPIPGTRQVLVSSFGDMKVFRVNLSDPKYPFITGELKMEWDTGTVDPVTHEPIIYSFFAEDIAVSQDGTFAVVTDGGFSPYIAFIDLATFKIKKIQKVAIVNPNFPDDRTKDRPLYAQSVAITPDGKTILFVDYFTGAVNSGRVNAAKDGLTSLHSLLLCTNPDPVIKTKCLGVLARPVNVTVSPDGRTALAAIASANLANNDPAESRIAALTIDPLTGAVGKGVPFFVRGLPAKDSLTPPGSGGGGNQSIVIAPGGASFVLTQPIGEVDDPDSDVPTDKVNRLNILAKLQIFAPGKVKILNAKYRALRTRGTSQLFGVDTLALSSNGRWLVASNPTLSGGTNVLTAVNVLNGRTFYVKLPYEAIPVGVGIIN